MCAYPFLHQSTWDDGATATEWDQSETDTSNIMDAPHYKELSRAGFAPWQGGHCLRMVLNGTAVSDVQEDSDFDTTTGNTIHIWFTVLIGADLSISDGDEIILFALQSSGSANDVVFGVDRSGSQYRLFAGETGATNTLNITRSNSRWYQIELTAVINAGAGTLDWYVDGNLIGGQMTGITHASIIQGLVGAISGTAANNAGTILIGGLIADDARIFPRERFPNETFWVTRDQTAWVGPCTLDAASVSGTSTNAVMTILDTDIFTSTGTSFSREPVVYVRNITANDQSPGFNTPVVFKKGAYVQLTGTNPQAWVSIKRPSDVVQSNARYISRGRGRKQYR